MDTWTIFGIIASVASIVSLVVTLVLSVREGRRRDWILLTILAFALVGAGYSAFRLQQEKLLASQLRTLKLPEGNDFEFMTAGQHCGFVLAVMSILEERKAVIPESYQTAAKRQTEACGTIRDTSDFDRFLADRKITEHAAGAMAELVRQLRQQ